MRRLARFARRAHAKAILKETIAEYDEEAATVDELADELADEL